MKQWDDSFIGESVNGDKLAGLSRMRHYRNSSRVSCVLRREQLPPIVAVAEAAFGRLLMLVPHRPYLPRKKCETVSKNCQRNRLHIQSIKAQMGFSAS
jgi:hypothetical protein